MSPREVLRVFEEFVRRDGGKRRAAPDAAEAGRRAVAANAVAAANRNKRS
jgi:hypothetical protein